MLRPSHLSLLSAAVLLSACAGQGDYPSLAPRPIERELSGAPVPPCEDGAEAIAPVAPVLAPVVANDPQLQSRVGELLALARAGDRDFAALRPVARASVARAGAAGSDPWIEAQQLLSRLEAARSKTAVAVAELDSLIVARAGDPATSAEDRERLLEAAREVRALADAQRAAVERLNAGLSRL